MPCDGSATWTDSIKDCVCPKQKYVMEV